MDEPLGFVAALVGVLLAVFGLDWIGDRTAAERAAVRAVRDGAVVIADADNAADRGAAETIALQTWKVTGRGIAHHPDGVACCMTVGVGGVSARGVPAHNGGLFGDARFDVGAACWHGADGRVNCAWGTRPSQAGDGGS